MKLYEYINEYEEYEYDYEDEEIERIENEYNADINDIYFLIKEAPEYLYNEIADALLDILEEDDFNDILDIEESRFKNKSKGIRKFKKTKSQLRRQKKMNKAQKRKARIEARKRRKKDPIGIKKYQKTYYKAVKSGKHIPKKHRGK